MDLHVVGPLASPAERAGIESVVGPREPGLGGHASRGGHAARGRRDLLLPALHAVQARVGWISQPALNEICRRLTIPPAEAYGVASFYALFSLASRPPVVAHVCDDIACLARGADQLCADLERTLGPAGTPSADGRTTWLRSPCLGLCERAPAALVTVAGEEPRTFAIAPATTARVAAELSDAAIDISRADRWPSAPIPQAGDPALRLLARVGRVDPASLDAYRAAGGYEALGRAFELGPEVVIRELLASKLVGRGGAAFPAGRKWEAVAAAPEHPHYLVCNADESEPGTFKDRVLMEEDPFAIVEAMTIAGVTTGCERGYLYLRAEYPLAAARLTHAIAEARAQGLLGPDVMGRGVAFDIEIRRGAGAYICGEETALFNSIEGKRGEPRNKPPFPVQVGLFGKPTVVNNVETLANVPLIILGGGEAYARIGTEGSTGPKLFCLSGNVTRPGLYEVEFGATLRQLMDLAGGVEGGRALQAVLLGGAAGTFVGPDQLDMPLTFEGTRAAGATLGSGVIMVFDEAIDLPAIVLRIAAFFRHESCGQCVPCRVGTVRQEELLRRLVAGRPNGSRADELRLFDEIAQAMRDASICGLGQTAASAVGSALHGGLAG
ncbi:MAG: putative respiratory chain oxidoreductase, NADH-quinone oxidoreductase subunit F [Chloroflexi bacterium CSP1-4]|nr:MAG: putative respiratory chain oxidoreductase, NADH-quinone oxidoreductase subunit F [Chloroflexi bacterium CSP1-4]